MTLSAFLFVNNIVACSHKLCTKKRLWRFYNTNILLIVPFYCLTQHGEIWCFKSFVYDCDEA